MCAVCLLRIDIAGSPVGLDIFELVQLFLPCVYRGGVQVLVDEDVSSY